MGRHYPSFLHAYKEYIIRQESPEIFHIWVALTIIAATLKRNVWIDQEAYKIYPNLYTILVADSALCRKSTAMDMGLDLLSENKSIRTVNERASLEGLQDYMNYVGVSPSGKIRPDGSVLIHADELANFLNKKNYAEGLMVFLTAAYTGKAKLDFLTKGRGMVQTRNPCPTIIAATTPNQFGGIFPADTLETGFLGRIVVVSSNDEVELVAKPRLKREMAGKLVDDLFDMADLEGEIKLTEKCDELFVDWYESGKMGQAPIVEMVPYYRRKHIHALKIAMLLSVNESNAMTITENHLLTAINLLEATEPGMAQVLERVGAEKESHTEDLVWEILKQSSEPISHSVLFRRIHRRVKNAEEFAAIIESLNQQEKLEFVQRGNALFYKYKDGGKNV